MLPRERVLQVINKKEPDRMPVYGWVSANLTQQVSDLFGTVESFEDHYEFDFAHLFGGPGTYDNDVLEKIRAENDGEVPPGVLLDVPMKDPASAADYENVRAGVRHHKVQRGRWVYMQTPGIFEALNGPFGIENHLAYMLMYKDEVMEVYRRQAEWNRQFAGMCLEAGVDMIHVSDDWGAQVGPMFSPKLWWEMIYPAHKITCDYVKAQGAYLSLHSDGNVLPLVDGIVELGYDVVHPWQESAGMDLKIQQEKYKDAFTVMGGLDVQSTIGFGKLDHLEQEIRRVIGMFPDKRLLYCTTHFIQDHCSKEELIFAYDLIAELTRGKK